MNRTYFLVAIGLLSQAAILAQAQSAGAAYLQLFSTGRGDAAGAIPVPRAEPGKPFSATATAQTTQTFVDGTHVSQTSSLVEYRDAEGRVRTETVQPDVASSYRAKVAASPTTSAGGTMVVSVRDPVSGVDFRLDAVKKTAMKSQIRRVAIAGPGGRGGGIEDVSIALPTVQAQLQIGADQLLRITSDVQAGGNNLVEDLGMMTINGVPARGTRTTTIVPVGAIGNDREFHSVSERWYSSDLNLLIKSVSTDPRFGTTTYELTNISRQSPDPGFISDTSRL